MNKGEQARREAIVNAALSWRNTPYIHQASLKGVGCDCIGLVRGVLQQLTASKPIIIASYSPDWAEKLDSEILIQGLKKYLRPTPLAQVKRGDVLVFRMKPNAIAKHAAILIEGAGLDDPEAKIIHAYWGHAVMLSWLRPFWIKHCVAAFAFPI